LLSSTAVLSAPLRVMCAENESELCEVQPRLADSGVTWESARLATHPLDAVAEPSVGGTPTFCSWGLSGEAGGGRLCVRLEHGRVSRAGPGAGVRYPLSRSATRGAIYLEHDLPAVEAFGETGRGSRLYGS